MKKLGVKKLGRGREKIGSGLNILTECDPTPFPFPAATSSFSSRFSMIVFQSKLRNGDRSSPGRGLRGGFGRGRIGPTNWKLGSAKKSLSGTALATGSGSAEEPAASALPLT
jgi:hypothetical protein